MVGRARQIEVPAGTDQGAVAITGGTINGTTIGATTPSSGAFTTLSATTTATVGTSLQTPLVIGGTGTTSTLSMRPTSGVGTTGADIIFQVGNNGATEAGRILNAGTVQIGGSVASSRLTQFDTSGRITFRYDDNSTQNQITLTNRAISAVGNGVAILAQLADSSSAAVNASRIITSAEATTYSGATADASLTIQTATNGTLADRLKLNSLGEAIFSGSIGVAGVTAPTARVHIRSGSATASTAPLKFTAGTNLTTPEAGAVEFDGSNYFATIGATRYIIPRVLTGSATLDFPNTPAGTSSDLTITVVGAAESDPVDLGVPAAVVLADSVFFAWISAADTVSVRFDNTSGGAKNPASGLFKVIVHKF